MKQSLNDRFQAVEVRGLRHEARDSSFGRSANVLRVSGSEKSDDGDVAVIRRCWQLSKDFVAVRLRQA